ncbi:MmoB/DmpM family protein [Oryzisolibacter sp. LB2S]|uniref:MmoB/DmpM family protein n=1 Tax=Alicycliphilus soli TaxID=3228789 RepID=UPI0034599E48
MSNVFIAFQKNEDSRAIVNAILADNPGAIVSDQPAMVKIDVPHRLVVRRATVEEELGREFDLQEMQVHLITMSGNVDETDDEFSLTWNQ